MKQIVPLWLLASLLLPAWQTRGQETDSAFFAIDSLTAPLVGRSAEAPRRVTHQRVTAEPFMTSRVHFTSDFIRQFTDQTPDRDNRWPTGTQQTRQERIRALFDREDSRLERRTMGEKSGYARLVDQFVADVSDGQQTLGVADLNEQLYAEVTGRVTWQQQDHALTLYLKKSRSGADWCWAIIGAKTQVLLPDAGLIDQMTNRRDSLVFIPPNAHELNFMGLAKHLRSGNELGQFIHTASADDPQLKVIAGGLATGQLRLQALLMTTLWLNTPLGWVLQLRQFNRETDNAGWLISDLCRSGDATCLPPVLHRFMTNNPPSRKP